VSSVDKHGELHHSGSTEGGEGIQGRTHRAPGEQNIIHQDDYCVVNPFLGKVSLCWSPMATALKIIAIHRHIKNPMGHCGARN
jgi:hypothetical protein